MYRTALVARNSFAFLFSIDIRVAVRPHFHMGLAFPNIFTVNNQSY